MSNEPAGQQNEKWKVIPATPTAGPEGVEAFIQHRDIFDLNIPSIAVLRDSNADDSGPEGLAAFLNSLDAHIATLETENAALRGQLGTGEDK